LMVKYKTGGKCRRFFLSNALPGTVVRLCAN
jgi:hypothetical protein